MNARAKAYQLAGEAIWERYKKALNNNEIDIAVELRIVALSMAKMADADCGQLVNNHKPIKSSLAEKIKQIARKSLCER